MEIESKFLVPNKRDFNALESLERLAHYTLSEARTQVVEDIFLDTHDKSIMAAGYYLRIRKVLGEDGKWVTIKSLGGFEAGTHTREEYVSFLPEENSVLECPDLQIRNMVFELTAGLDLHPLLSLKQKRRISQVNTGDKLVAEIYLDQVNLKRKSKEKNYNEFEVELKEEGRIEDLQIIKDFLLTNYKITENSFSKFETAFLFMENLPEKTLLSLPERAYCMQLAAQKNKFSKKARILLALDEAVNKGQAFEELGSRLEIPLTEINSLYSRFEKERLSIFPFKINTGTSGKSFEFHLQPRTCNLKKQEKNTDFKEWRPEALLEYYEADKNRAEKARNNALALFDRLSTCHGLGQEEREILRTAAFLKDIASSVFAEEKTEMTKEILLSHPLKGLKSYENLMVSLIIELQDPCVNEKNCIQVIQTSSIKLPPGLENKALTIAAILKTAGVFDTLEEVQLGEVRDIDNAVEIEIIEEVDEKLLKKAEKKSELWKYLFGKKLVFVQDVGKKIRKTGKTGEITAIEENAAIKEEPETQIAKERQSKTEIKGDFQESPKKEDLKESEREKEKEEEKRSEKKKKKLKKVVVDPADSMAGLACRILSYQFASMLAHEKGTIKGEEIEELHDMRVAVRRMRAASKVFEAYLDSSQLEPYLKELRKTLRALGRVRDLDVFQEKAENYLKTLPSEREHDLDSLFAIISEEKEKARTKMTDYLESGRHSLFKQEFSTLLASPETLALPTTNKKHDALPHRVKDVLPSILYARTADITAYSEWVEGPYLPIGRLHRLRIAAKGMRYTLEFFENVLGEDAKTMIQDFKNLQDHLGDLHDAIVAIDMLSVYLKTGEWGSEDHKKSSGKEIPPETPEGIKAYLAYREKELGTLLNTFPEAWEKIKGENLRQRIDSMIKNLYKPE
jgi:CHAD domain-containing protein